MFDRFYYILRLPPPLKVRLTLTIISIGACRSLLLDWSIHPLVSCTINLRSGYGTHRRKMSGVKSTNSGSATSDTSK